MTYNPAPRKGLGLSEFNEDKLLMFLTVEEQLDAINLPLRVRRGSLRLDYTDKMPKLWVRTPSTEPEVAASLDIRTSTIRRHFLTGDNSLMFNHIQERLQAIGCKLFLVQYKSRKTQRRVVKFQIDHKDARTVRCTLLTTTRGRSTDWDDKFTPPEL